MRRAIVSAVLVSLAGCTPDAPDAAAPRPETRPQALPPAPAPAPAPAPVPELDEAMLVVPSLVGSFDHCALDVDVPAVQLAAPLVSLVVVARESANASVAAVDCSRPVMLELPREALTVAPPDTTGGPTRLRVRVEPPAIACGKSYALGLCMRDSSGALHASRGPVAAHTEVAADPSWYGEHRLLTPSGETADLVAPQRGMQLIGADPTTGARVRVEVRALRERRSSRVLEVRLTTGEPIVVLPNHELWRVETAAWVRASEVVAGDRLFGREGPVEAREVTERKKTYGSDITDVSAPDTFFLDRLLVRDGKPSAGESTPLAADEDPTRAAEVALVAARESYDCMLDAALTVRTWPAGAESIRLIAGRHPGPRGARVPLPCDPQQVFADVPRALWDAWHSHPATAKLPLTLALEVGGDGEQPGFRGVVGCSSDVALLACASAADGTLTPVSGAARWGLSGATCFATGTPIETPDGPVAIEALAPGARVLSHDVLSGEARVAHVLRRVSRGEQPVLQLRLADGRALRVTAEHPLWLPRVGAFRVTKELRVGERLLGSDGAEVPIESIVADGTSEVWELSVEAPDTYFAGGILAHNY
ncbi:polymorphic toxin-type HINT domain-containing protein [Nannocystis bainbridge]|uniref:Polymorphic toxin-type HINT domain-containing protein n=1 Tax=Nannocystis bainbridge TaxID=2995303 RepID=A0ABT5E4E2_9BACT|nr:polymorphic toxin-type HINT domain-containing protein [Nannocystis bainbridge]MDC0720275.1 polymorphic toxin-type HINT domain-containing protein [Nannocystis bainbridge]